METIRLPDGTTIQVPSDMSRGERLALDQAIREKFGQQGSDLDAGLGSLRRGEDDGTTLGAAWQGVKNIPRGAWQFKLMAQQGIEALRTPDEDTAKEKEIRRKLNALYASQDPRYSESNLAQLGMGLGQVGAMIGTSMIPIVGKPIAFGGAALMGAGEAAGRIAEYEERTGEDVATGKEIKALAGGLGIGMLEMVPFGVPARYAKYAKGVLPSTGRQAAETLAARTVRRSTTSALERGLEDAGSYAASALITGAGEAAQEASAGFLQSALGLVLYDDDAMADAGPNALKEAIIGGEVGAVADVLMRMAGSKRRGKYRKHQEARMVNAVEQEVARAWTDMREGNIRLDRKAFTERVLSADPNDQAFIEAIMDGSILENARAESEAKQTEIRNDPELESKVRDQQLEEEVKKATEIFEHIEVMKFGVGAVRSGNLAPDELASEIVADEEALPEVDVSIEEGARLPDQAGIVERAFRGESTREDAADAGAATMVGIAPVDAYDAKQTLSYVWRNLRPTKKEVGVAERARLQKEGVDEAEIEAQVAASVDAFTQGEEDVLALSGRLVTQGQRDALASLVEMAEGDGPALSPTQLRGVVNGVFQGGVYDLKGVSWNITPEGVPTIDVPPVGFHGTKAEFDAFSLSSAGLSDPGLVGKAVYLTPSEAQAKTFAESPHYGGRAGTPRVVAARLGFKNPMVIEDNILPDGRPLSDAHPDGITPESSARLQEEIIAEGYDGVIFRMGGEPTQYAVFNPEDASVIGPEAQMEAARPPTAEETERGMDRASNALNAVLSFDALADLGTQVTDNLKGTETTDAGREGLAVHVAEPDVVSIVDDFKANKGKVTEDLAQRALDAKEIRQDLKSFVAETLEMEPGEVAWESLQEGEQHAVFSRILRSEVQSIEGAAHSGSTTLPPEAQQGVLAALTGGTPIPTLAPFPAAPTDGTAQSVFIGELLDIDEAKARTAAGVPESGPTIAELGHALEARAIAIYGRLLDLRADKDEIVRVLVEEVKRGVTKVDNAADWYKTNLEAAFQIWAKNRPVMLTNPIYVDVARLALAVSSNGAAVPANAENAIEIFDYYVKNGKFPTTMGRGKEKAAINKGFITMNQLIENIGVENALGFLDTTYSIRDLKAAGFTVTGEAIDSNLPGSIIFGPKVGGAFYQNLGGFFDPVTMDRWFRRTIGRITGDMIEKFQPKTIADGRERLRTAGLLENLKKPLPYTFKGVKKKGNPSLLTPKQRQAMRIYKNASDADMEASAAVYLQHWESLFRERSAAITQAKADNKKKIAAVKKQETRLKAAKTNAARNPRDADAKNELKAARLDLRAAKKAKADKIAVPDVLVKPEWALAAERHLAHVRPQIREAPKSSERGPLRAIVNAVRQKVKEDTGQEYDNAALQAIIWYPEKRLYQHLGVPQKDSDIGYEEAFNKHFVYGPLEEGAADVRVAPPSELTKPIRTIPVDLPLAGKESTGFRGGLDDPAATLALIREASEDSRPITKRRPYKKIKLGKPGKRNKPITDLATELNVDPEQVVDYIERTIAAGLVKYTNEAKTEVQFVSPQEAAEYAPKPTERSVEVERIKEEIRLEGKLRSEEQVARDAETINNARLRLESFKEKVRAQFKRMGKPDVGIKIVVAADSIYADIKDIYLDPDVIEDSRSSDTGPSASVRSHGAMVLFNLSQMEGRYKDGIKTDIDTLVKDSAFHEGAHLWYMNDDLHIGEQRSLERYGKMQRVPKAVNEDAFDAGQTWRQWTESIYGPTDPNIVEETSVRILDALAQGQIPKAKSAGFMSKIAGDLLARAKGIVGAARDSDVLSVMDIYEKIQGGELKRRSEAKTLEFGGASTVQILDRSTPEQFEELRQAAETGSETEVEAAARKIVRSRAEGPTVSLQQSLLNDLRARREIDDTPNSVTPVLNKQAIEAGEISAAALNAYFEFNDASVRPYNFLEGTRYKGDSPRQMLEVSGGTQPGGPNSLEGEDGKSRPIATKEDFDKQITYKASDIFRMKLLDKRLPQWFSAKRAAGRDGALKQLAHLSAIAAWRMADAAQLHLSNQMRDGPIVWDSTDPNDPSAGGISFGTDLEVDGRRVKSFRDISNPLLKAGEKVIARAYEFLVAHRVVDVHNELAAARAALKAARASDAALVAAYPSPPVDPRLLPTPKLDKGLAKAAPKYSEATLQFESDIDRAAYIIGNRKGKRSKADAKYVKWLAERGVDLAAAIKLRTKIIAGIKSEYTGDAGQVIKIPADAGANQAFAPAVAPVPGLTAPTTMSKLESAVTTWKERYDKVNPQRTSTDPATGKKRSPRRWTIKEMQEVISKVEAGVKNGDANSQIIVNFKQEYGDFNHHLIQFLFKTGQITDAKRKTLQRLSYVPFMRDQGWEKSQPLVNSRSDGSRGQMMIDKSLEGSWDDLDPNLMGSIISNISAVTRDGLWNIAAQRTVRDELSVDTAVEITEKNRGGEGKRELDEADFSDIVVMLKVDGETKVFRLKDPLLSQSIMMSGFNPVATIEAFFGKVFMAGGTTLGVKNEAIAKGLTKLLVGPSKVLRELVTRSPPFVAKNVLRDSMQASVLFGGGPLMTLKAIGNVFTPGLLAKAQQRGLSQPIDYTPGKESAAKAERLLTQDEIRGLTEGPIPVVTTLWDWLGHVSQKSEVATRMAVYDAVMKDTGGDTTEAMYQAMEIMNYSRRGSSSLFTTLAAMSPFINGRMQGLDVFLRTQLGSADAPGLYGKEFDDSKAGRLSRAGTAAARGSYIAFGTFLYWLAMHDEEEYKNTPEDLKDDWWLLPMPKGRLGLKIPIPFEVGLFYKVIPEQILRTISEDQHDFGDMTDAMKRQVFNTLWLDLRPQAIRPMIDAASNRSVWTRGQIVPTWMENSVAASEQYNPATNEVARLVSKNLDSIPLLKGMDFLTSPMKMEYMLRQYGGTLGTYVMVLTDRLIREAGDKNIVGTPADFGFDTLDKMPMIGDLLYDRESGGGYQESFYEMVEDLDLVLSTIGEMEGREDRDRTAEDEYKEKHEPLLVAGKRLKHFEKRMDHWRADRDRLFTRNDLSDQDKRRTLYRMFEDRDDILSEMLELMGDIRGAEQEQFPG